MLRCAQSSALFKVLLCKSQNRIYIVFPRLQLRKLRLGQFLRSPSKVETRASLCCLRGPWVPSKSVGMVYKRLVTCSWKLHILDDPMDES